MPNKKSNQKGFTLVELLISIAIIAILSTIGIASFNNYSSREGVKNAAFELQSDLRKYQNFMISGQENLKPDVTNACYTNGYRSTVLTYGILEGGGATPSKLNILAIYKKADGSPCKIPPCLNIPGLPGACPISKTPGAASTRKVWPDPNVGQVLDVGYNSSGDSSTDQSCGGTAYIMFYPGRDIPGLACTSGGGMIPTWADRIYIDLGRGATIYYRVYVTNSGMIYVQKKE